MNRCGFEEQLRDFYAGLFFDRKAVKLLVTEMKWCLNAIYDEDSEIAAELWEAVFVLDRAPEELTPEMLRWVGNAERTNLLDPTLNFEYEFDLDMGLATRLYDVALDYLGITKKEAKHGTDTASKEHSKLS